MQDGGDKLNVLHDATLELSKLGRGERVRATDDGDHCAREGRTMSGSSLVRDVRGDDAPFTRFDSCRINSMSNSRSLQPRKSHVSLLTHKE
jgi:hypothetical protein